MRNFIILVLSMFTVSVAVANHSSKAANIYQQSAAHNKIKLQTKNEPAKKIKIKDTNPLPPSQRPSIRAKAFQQQQYSKATGHSTKSPTRDDK